MTLKTKLTTAIATGAVLLNALAPAAFATTITVTGNGDSSANHIDVSNNNSTEVTQSNHSNVTNNVSSTANTGGNEADRNTGGNSSVDTGDATSTVKVTTAANTNTANVTGCNCDNSDTTVKISGNGTDSNNSIDLDNGRKGNDTTVDQHNYSTVNNQISSDANTGGNGASRNTGGTSSVNTGNATSDVTVSTSTNVNAAQVGSSNAGAGNGGLSVVVAGNGDSSRNSIDLNTHNSVELKQNNDSYIKNYVQSNANAGGNEADRNTGGNVKVDTGNAKSNVTVTNEPNFNAANVDDCGCTTDLTLKVAGNGVDSNNKIDADTGSELTVGNFNGSYIDNELTPTAKTGWNEADRNTGAVVGIDPVTVTTGNADSETKVSNSGNSNSFGQAFDLPSMGNVNFTTDFQSFWAAWMGWFSNQG